MTAFLLSALLRLVTLFDDHSATDAMIQRAGCPSNPYLAAMIDLHSANRRESALLAALWRTEGHCSSQAIGDNGRSYGGFQQFGRPGEWAWLLGNVEAQVRQALVMIRASWFAGRGRPDDERLSVYARGRHSARGIELSRVRVRLAKWASGGKW